mgnify:CR=1 FL=1
MRWDSFLKFTVFSLLVLLSATFYGKPLADSIKQGLDLQGGTHIVLEGEDSIDGKVTDDAMNRVVKIIERRVNELGLTEPIVQRQGQKRVIVELPGINDPEKAIAMIGKTALLEFKDPQGRTVLTGKDLKDSRAQIDGQNKRPLVGIEFTDAGSKKFEEVTRRLVGQPIEIVFDGETLMKPNVNEPISGGKAVITGNRSMEEAEHMAILLRSGALPVKVNIMENRTVGPSLGQDSKEKSMKAFEIGVIGILVFMLVFYKISGFVANIALILYVLLLLLSMKYMNATLTLPGIAGVILSMGMAIDGNVLIFERFKEELHSGKTLRAAMDSGFNRAFGTILDGNVTTLFVAVVLFYLGTGPIKGFAVTLIIGLILSMFTAVTVTKFLLKSLIASNVIKNSKYFGA